MRQEEVTVKCETTKGHDLKNLRDFAVLLWDRSCRVPFSSFVSRLSTRNDRGTARDAKFRIDIFVWLESIEIRKTPSVTERANCNILGSFTDVILNVYFLFFVTISLKRFGDIVNTSRST